MIYVMGGGGGGITGNGIVVHTEHGSTVAAYSDSAFSTKVKDGKEVGASGDYVISGLTAGTYYVKATSGTKTATSGAVVVDGIETVNLPYALVLFENGTVNSILGALKNIHLEHQATHSWAKSGNNLVLDLTSDAGYAAEAWDGFNNAVNFGNYSWATNLHVTIKRTGGTDGAVRLATTNGYTTYATTKSIATGEQTIDIPLASYRSQPYFIIFYADSGGNYGDITYEISKIWAD